MPYRVLKKSLALLYSTLSAMNPSFQEGFELLGGEVAGLVCL